MPKWPFQELYGPQFNLRMIRQSNAFVMWHTHDIGDGVSHDVQLKTGDKIVLDETRFDIVENAPVLFELFEVESLTDGTEFTTYSCINRINPTTPTISFYESPTNLSGMTKIDERIILQPQGTKRAESIREGDIRFLLKPNSNYVLRITNQTNNPITSQTKLFWLELLPEEFILA